MSTQWQRLDKYELRERLGDGGQGEVWKAFDVQLHRFVAIKVFHTQLTGEDAEQFRAKANILASLSHPHIISMYELGVDSGEHTPYLVMEYAPGGSLRTRHPKGSQVPLATVIEYLNELALTLRYAHDNGILHGDIKPENMLIGWGRHLFLSDFSIAQLSQTGRTWLQGHTDVEGTPYYMAPEQFLGKSEKASDQYALAIVVYEWLSGTVPFSKGNWIELGLQHLHEPVPSLRTLVPALPVSIERAVMKALAKQPQDRFPSIEAFVQALQTPSTFIDVFISYAQGDQNLCDQLENHLSNLKYCGLITTWTTKKISAGEEIIQQTDVHLNTADLILLLISANFLASKYCYSRDMMQAIQRHNRGEARVIPVLLRPVVFTDMPFAKLQPLPTNGKPVVKWRNRDSAFVDIALGIERVAGKRHVLASHESDVPLVKSVAIDPVPSAPAPTQIADLSTPPSQLTHVHPPHHEIRMRRMNWRVGCLGLSLLGLLSVGVLLVQHPNLIPFAGVIVGSLILLAGILLAIRVLVKRALSRTARRREQQRELQRQEERRREQEQAQRRQLEEARRREQQRELQRQEERRREREEARRRELEEAQRREHEQAYYGKALAAYEEALRQNNVDATAYRGKGNALVGLERYDEALTAFEQALVLTPLPTTYVSVGNVLAILGRCDEAVAAYEQALVLDASYASAYTGMSKALSQLGRTQEAEQAYQQAKELGDED